VNTDLLRAIIVVVNLGFIGGTGFMAYTIFRPERGSTVPKKEQVPSIEVAKFAIKTTAIERRSIKKYMAIWKSFRPIPKKVAPKVEPKVEDVKPTMVEKIGPVINKMYLLVGVSLNKENPDRSTVFMKRKTNNSRLLIKVGEAIPETAYILTSLSIASETSIKATVRSKSGKSSEITMVRGFKKGDGNTRDAAPPPGNRGNRRFGKRGGR
jgi:hypothetical protein